MQFAVRFVLCSVLLATTALAFSLPPQPGCPKHPTSSKARHDASPGGSAVVQNEFIRLGITKYGSLGAQDTIYESRAGMSVGIQFLKLTFDDGLVGDATAPGCICEGWGTRAQFSDGSSVEGGHSVNTAPYFNTNLFGVSDAVSDATTATTTVSVGPVNAPASLRVKHFFRPAPATPYLYQVTVSIKNTGTRAITKLQYIRTMDWDVAPTEFDECVDIVPNKAGDIECVHTDGFVIPTVATYDDFNPEFYTSRGKCNDSNFESIIGRGPADHGSAWLFTFHDINEANPFPVGATKEFQMYYGAGNNKVHTQGIIAAADLEAWTVGYPNLHDTCDNDEAYRYIFGFGDIGGEPFVPPCGDGDCLPRSVKPACADHTVTVGTTSQSCLTLSFDGADDCQQ